MLHNYYITQMWCLCGQSGHFTTNSVPYERSNQHDPENCVHTRQDKPGGPGGHGRPVTKSNTEDADIQLS